MPHHPAATVNVALRQWGSKQHTAWTLFCFTVIQLISEVHLIVTQEVPDNNETLRKNFLPSHLDIDIEVSLHAETSACVLKAEQIISSLHKSHLTGLETKHCL